MKRILKKGFTLVELVIVIAVIAVLAAVLIPTFSSIIKQAEQSAYLQERTNQQLQDLIEKINNQNYMTWEDFESKLAEELAKLETSDDTELLNKLQERIDAAISALNNADKGLTEDQIEKIIQKALEGQLTTAQVQAIVQEALKDKNISAADIQKIVNNAIEELRKEIGDTAITSEQMKQAIDKAIEEALAGKYDDLNDLKGQVESIIGKLDNTLTEEQIEQIIKDALDKLGQEDEEGGEESECEHVEEIVYGYDATCTEPGLSNGKKCSKCTVTLESQTVIEAKGHKSPEGTYACKDYLCQTCSTLVESTSEHDYQNGTCICGEVDPNYSQGDENPDEVDPVNETHYICYNNYMYNVRKRTTGYTNCDYEEWLSEEELKQLETMEINGKLNYLCPKCGRQLEEMVVGICEANHEVNVCKFEIEDGKTPNEAYVVCPVEGCVAPTKQKFDDTITYHYICMTCSVHTDITEQYIYDNKDSNDNIRCGNCYYGSLREIDESECPKCPKE